MRTVVSLILILIISATAASARANPIADYAPPVRLNATMPDLDDNVWILPQTTTLSRHGELVYDVVNAKGELFQRVRLPLAARSLGSGEAAQCISGQAT